MAVRNASGNSVRGIPTRQNYSSRILDTPDKRLSDPPPIATIFVYSDAPSFDEPLRLTYANNVPYNLATVARKIKA